MILKQCTTILDAILIEHVAAYAMMQQWVHGCMGLIIVDVKKK